MSTTPEMTVAFNFDTFIATMNSEWAYDEAPHYCEQHPGKAWPHDDCAGPGVALNLPETWDILEAAWGIIANAHGGYWNDAPKEWSDAAQRWRDRYFASTAVKSNG